MAAVVIVGVQPPRQRFTAFDFGVVGAGVGPLVEQGAVEPPDLAVGLASHSSGCGWDRRSRTRPLPSLHRTPRSPEMLMRHHLPSAQQRFRMSNLLTPDLARLERSQPSQFPGHELPRRRGCDSWAVAGVQQVKLDHVGEDDLGRAQWEPGFRSHFATAASSPLMPIAIKPRSPANSMPGPRPVPASNASAGSCSTFVLDVSCAAGDERRPTVPETRTRSTPLACTRAPLGRKPWQRPGTAKVTFTRQRQVARSPSAVTCSKYVFATAAVAAVCSFRPLVVQPAHSHVGGARGASPTCGRAQKMMLMLVINVTRDWKKVMGSSSLGSRRSGFRGQRRASRR